MHRQFIAALVAAASLGAAPATASGALRCQDARSPTATAAWRAYVPARTPIHPRRGAAASGVTSRGRWLLVVGSASVSDGSCLLEVRLERRPNHATGWGDGAAGRPQSTAWRIDVSRVRRRVTLRHAGRLIGHWSVVVGKPSTPTPRGLFAIQDNYRSPADSFEGSWILTLTAHSDVLKRFEGGDGQIALHG